MSQNYFQPAEYACKCKYKICASKDMRLAPQLIQALNRVREAYGKPITITSGIRCPEHNKAVGGSRGSKHMLGEAVDITAEDLNSVLVLIEAESDIRGIGNGIKHGHFLHIDVRQGVRKTWTYPILKVVSV